MHRLFRFRVTSLLWLLLSCGLVCGWWKDRNDQQRRVAVLEQRLQDAETLAEMRRVAAKLKTPQRRGLVMNTDPARSRRLKLSVWFDLDAALSQMKVHESPWRPELEGLSCEAQAAWLDHADAGARLAAVNELSKHGADAVLLLVKALEDQDLDVVWLALHGLRRCGQQARPALPQIHAVARKHRSPLGVYAALIEREIDPQSDIDFLILWFAGADDPDTQELAFALHEQAGSPQAASALVESLRSSAKLSAAGIQALGDIAQPEQAIPLLIRVFREASDDDTRQIAAYALARIEARAAAATST